MTDTQDPSPRDAYDVERHPCPRCDVQPGSPCRSRGGAVAGAYHTGRFTKVPRLAKQLRVQTPADRRPGQPWRPGTPPPAPAVADTPGADIRIGYARCSHLSQELDPQHLHFAHNTLLTPATPCSARPAMLRATTGMARFTVSL
ncbi:hypothetical protein ABZ372_22785, partial [Streptomyces sp. NPDC005921]